MSGAACQSPRAEVALLASATTTTTVSATPSLIDEEASAVRTGFLLRAGNEEVLRDAGGGKEAGADSTAPSLPGGGEQDTRVSAGGPLPCLDAPITMVSPPSAVVVVVYEDPGSAESTEAAAEPGVRPISEITTAADSAAAAAEQGGGECDMVVVAAGRSFSRSSNGPCRAAAAAADGDGNETAAPSRNDGRDNNIMEPETSALGSSDSNIGNFGRCGSVAAAATTAGSSLVCPSTSRLDGVADATEVGPASSPSLSSSSLLSSAAPRNGANAGVTSKKRGRGQGAAAALGGGVGVGVGVESSFSGPGVPAGTPRQPPNKTKKTNTIAVSKTIAVVSTPETVTSVWDLDSEEEEYDEDEEEQEGKENEGGGGSGDNKVDVRGPAAIDRSGERVMIVGSDEARARPTTTTTTKGTGSAKALALAMAAPMESNERTKSFTQRETPEAAPVSCSEHRRREVGEETGEGPTRGEGAVEVDNGIHAAQSPPKEKDGGGQGGGGEGVSVVARTKDMARQLMPPPPPNVTRAKMRRRRSRVTLMHSQRYQRLCGLVERHGRRDDLLYALMAACSLQGRLNVVSPARATAVHLRAFHDRDYVEALRTPPSDVKALDEYGLLDDCEVFEELFDYCCAVAGASLHGADRLCRGDADVAINWGGGRHHAKKGEAAGFCYVNDSVLAALHLAKTFGRVLTVDIDVHHGDGLQEAFYMSNKVMTMSFHHLGKGFFPGAGQCSETGAGNGRGFNLNVPLKEGCGDASFLRVFTSVLSCVFEGFQPDVVLLVCGGDTLSADPLGPFNLTSSGIRACVEQVVALDVPLLMLGGGGYCPTDTARLWTTLAAAAVGPEALASLPVAVPDHAYFPLYGPDFRVATRAKTLPDQNDDDFLAGLCDFASQAGRRLKAAREAPDRFTFKAYSDSGGESW